MKLHLGIAALTLVLVAAGAWADHDITVPYTAPEGTAVIDGDLSDWAGATWIAVDEVYDPTGADMSNAQYALRWSPATNMLYAAVSVTDSSQHFESSWVSWNTQDDVELYLDAGENNTGPDHPDGVTNYGTYQDYAQQMALGYSASGAWANFGWMLGEDLNVCPQYAAALNGSVITYEAAFVPYSYYTGLGGSALPEAIVTLTGGMQIGFDVVAVSALADGTYGGMKCNNTTSGKFKYSANMQRWVLDGGSSPRLPGDANGDCTVDLADFVLLKSNFGTGSTWEQGDFNEDGTVDLADFVILKTNFGSSCAQ